MNSKSIALALVLLFVGTAIAAPPAAIENDIESAISNSGPAGVDKLQGEWVSKQEIHQLYLRDGDSTSYGFCSGTGSNACTDGNARLYSDLSEVPIIPAGPADFFYGHTSMETPLHQLDANLFIAASSATTITVQLTADGVIIPGALATVTTADIGNLPSLVDPLTGLVKVNQASPYQASAVFSPPVIIPGDVDLGFRISSGVPELPGEVFLSFDGGSDLTVFIPLDEAEQSWIRMRTESAHVNAWTQDIDQEFQELFPLPSSAPTRDRTIGIPVAYVNSLGDVGLGRMAHSLEVRGASSGNLYFQRGGASDGISPWGFPTSSPGDITGTGDGIFLTTYQLTYPSTMAEIGDFTYRISSQNGGWSLSNEFVIGGGAFGISLVQTESATKEILLGSDTSFRFEVTNLGSVTDNAIITVAGDDAAWDVSLDPGAFLTNMKPGEKRVVTATIAHPLVSFSGDQFNLTIGAQSALSSTVATKLVKVILTDVPTYGVSLLGNILPVKMSPGESRTFPVTLRNDGNGEDRFVNSLSGAPLGWSVQVTPAVMDVTAKSQLPFFITVKAPADASRGDAFDLRLTTRRADDLSVSATKFIPVEVFLVDDFDFVIEDDSVAGKMQYITSTTAGAPFIVGLRDEGADAFEDAWDASDDPDNDFDTSAVFKAVLMNPGDTDDTITFIPAWASLTGLDIGPGSAVCDDPDGHPDGWRVRIWKDGDTPPAFATVNSNQMLNQFGGDFALLAGEETAIFVELKWTIPAGSNCLNSAQGTASGGRGKEPATEARLRLEAFSNNNPVNRFVHFVTADLELDAAGARQSSQMYAGAQRDVSIQVGGNNLDRTSNGFVSVDGTVAEATTFIPVKIRNNGNEMDTLRVSIPATLVGFTNSFANVDATYAFKNDVSVGHGGAGRTPGCEATATEGANLVRYCTLGAGDEIKFDVRVRAGNSVEIGDKVDFTVDVLSVDTLNDGQAGTNQDSLPVYVEALGNFVMDLLPNPSIGRLEYNVKAGQQLVIPVSLANQGSNSDTYNWAFSDVPADQKWIATLSHGGPLFVPAQRTLHGFTTIFVPADATVGDVKSFTLAAQSNTNTDSLNIQLKVVAGNNNVGLRALPGDIVTTFNSDSTVNFNVTKLAGTATAATVRLSEAPLGSVTTQGLPSVKTFNAGNYATGDFTISVGEELGTSRIPVLVFARTNQGEDAHAAYVVNFASTNLGFTATGPAEASSIIPGGETTVPINLKNIGLSSDLVKATVISAPTGWAASFAQSLVPLDPLGENTADLVVTAPDAAVRGQTRQVSILFESENDSQINARLDINFVVGISDLNLTLRQDLIKGAPKELITTIFSLSNEGEVIDLVDLSASAPGPLADRVNITVEKTQVRLVPGSSVDLTITIEMPSGIAGGTKIPITVTAKSSNANLQGLTSDTLTMEMLSYRSADIDGDGIKEHAVDRNAIVTDGYEQFLDPSTVGKLSSAPNMQGFLSAAGLAAKTVVEVIDNETVTSVNYKIDGDKDGFTDLFIDIDGDFIPDVFWAPSQGKFHEWTVAKDVDGDQIAEPFIDVNADGVLDVMFNFATGDFTDLLRVDVNDDGHFDYVVDANGNGIADATELVLFGHNGKVISIRELIDVDGDGKLDAVYDEDGDGIPDYFIPNGKTVGIPIVLRDVNGDGIDDWTYDADGDGVRESYYSPADGTVGFIDTSGNFGELVKEYWYVGALFMLVAVLFVVLMVVTRRS